MVEKKAKPAPKKAATGKSGSAVAAKPKTTKVSAAVTAKKTVSAAAVPKKTKTPVVEKAAVPTAEKKTPVKKAAATKARSTAAKRQVTKPTPEERYRMVQTAAYFIAERNGFAGCSIVHWADAEREISAKLGE